MKTFKICHIIWHIRYVSMYICDITSTYTSSLEFLGDISTVHSQNITDLIERSFFIYKIISSNLPQTVLLYADYSPVELIINRLKFMNQLDGMEVVSTLQFVICSSKYERNSLFNLLERLKGDKMADIIKTEDVAF